ncbi:response regulator [Verrucomicrobiota bacterium]
MSNNELDEANTREQPATEPRRNTMLCTFLLGASTGILLSVANFISGNHTVAWIELGLGIFAILIAANLRRIKSFRRTAEYLLLAGIALLTSILFTGGAKQAGLYWFAFFPAVAFFWLGLRRGACWTLALLGTCGLVTFLSFGDWIKLAFEPTQILMALFSTTIIATIVFFYERRRTLDSAMLQNTITDLDKARREAESLTQAKGEFLANMSHEIRTPLNGVVGMANILLQSELKEEQREPARVIHDSANVLLSLINNVLDFTQMEAGQLKLENSAFNMRTLLEEVTRVVATPAYQKDVEIILDYDESLGTLFMGDKKHLRQIMINLAGNAVKFTKKGHVLLRAKSSSTGNNRIYLEVKDTGIGIPEGQQDKIFDKFSQADTSAEYSFEGSGLGLAISNRLIQMMGSKISITSTPDQGSTFSFELELEALPDQNVEPAQRLAGSRALIVESYKPLAEMLQKQINALGATTEISNGEDLRQKLTQSERFDIILLDHKLHKDNLRPAAVIQELNITPPPRIYLLKAPTAVMPSEHLKAAGIWSTIPKPVIQRDLTDRLLNLHAVEKESAKPRPATKQGLRVLLVEDNLVNQKVARHFLERLNCEVDLAVNGREAVDATLSTTYDLIFMDCQMPEMDGYEATRAIRSNEKERNAPRHLPIIALTAHALDSDREKCLEVGMDDYLSKPINQKKLKKIISGYSE